MLTLTIPECDLLCNKNLLGWNLRKNEKENGNKAGDMGEQHCKHKTLTLATVYFFCFRCESSIKTPSKQSLWLKNRKAFLHPSAWSPTIRNSLRPKEFNRATLNKVKVHVIKNKRIKKSLLTHCSWQHMLLQFVLISSIRSVHPDFKWQRDRITSERKWLEKDEDALFMHSIRVQRSCPRFCFFLSFTWARAAAVPLRIRTGVISFRRWAEVEL